MDIIAIAAMMSVIEKKSDIQLVEDSQELAATEKKSQVVLIAHLAETAARRLHLDRGYASLFAYCQRELKLEEGLIWSRIQLSSCCRTNPELLAEFACGALSLSVAGKICPHINAENKTELLAFCRGKTVKQVEEYLANLRPRSPLPPSFRRQSTSSTATSSPEATNAAAGTTSAAATQSPKPSVEQLSHVEPELSFANEQKKALQRSQIEPLGGENYLLRCTISGALRRKLDRLGELLGIANTAAGTVELIERAVDATLQQKDPARPRQQRKRSAPAPAPAPAPQPPRSRAIPAAIRRQVFARAGYSCQFVSKEGVECRQRTFLEIDHVHPFARGGSHHPDNLRVLCRGHNQRQAELDFGLDFMQRTHQLTHIKTSTAG